MIRARDLSEAFLHFFYPHICCGCGTDIISNQNQLCLRCIASLPETGFEKYLNNPVERKFWGRLPLESAMSTYYFTPASTMQHLMHLFKYNMQKELGLQLGRMMGQHLLKSGRLQADVLVPLPLYPSKEKKRGYNQARVLCEGIADCLRLPIVDKAVIRKESTSSQTSKRRIERWQNMEGKFELINPCYLENKHLLLIDDVITTGATLEACGQELLKVSNSRLSIATLCIATK